MLHDPPRCPPLTRGSARSPVLATTGYPVNKKQFNSVGITPRRPSKSSKSSFSSHHPPGMDTLTTLTPVLGNRKMGKVIKTHLTWSARPRGSRRTMPRVSPRNASAIARRAPHAGATRRPVPATPPDLGGQGGPLPHPGEDAYWDGAAREGGRAMRFGLFSMGEHPGRLPRDAYDEDLREIVTADALGWDEVWIGEHHLNGRQEVLPSPEMLIAKAAARTERIRLGSGVRLLALHYPLDVAGEAAVADHLTDGRYNFGYGTGSPLEYPFYGVPFAEAQARLEESLDLIVQAWTHDGPFSWEGRY